MANFGLGRRRRLWAAAAGVALAAGATAPALAGPQHDSLGRQAPPIGHVFVLVLENEGYATTFGNPAADPYLAKSLPAEGALLTQYYGTGHESNDNYVAMVSGQGPNPQNQADCQIYDDFIGTTLPISGLLGWDGQAIGTGCVYPQDVRTVGNQLSDSGRSWKGYMQDMGNVPSREAQVCGHPALNSQDQTQSAVGGDAYVARHDPFVYFHSVVDD
ncbi:MAG TPA: alkaline phosphatase family protein, partial [Acidimicrobiales bacterium]|nr:alkaline phosphatase family protein [Acidimicrobiales bacterium]